MIISTKTDLQFEISNLIDSNGNKIRLKDCSNFICKFYTTDINNAALCLKLNDELTNIKIEEERDICVINSTDLSKMLDGVLYFNIEYGVPDESFQDGVFNKTVNGNTNFYIKLGNSEETEVDLSNYYTKDEVDKLLDDVVSGELDLSKYYTKDEVNELLENSKYVNESDLESTLFEYSTLDYVDEELSNKLDATAYTNDKSTFALKSELTSKQDTLVSGNNIKKINSQSLLGEGNIEIKVEGGGITDAPNDGKLYGRKSQQWNEIVIPTDYITNEELNEGLANKLDSSAYTADKETFALKSNVYSKSEVDEKIDAAITGGEVDLSNYYNKTESDNKFVEKVEGKQLSANDFTNEYKLKLDGLSNYNDSEIKSQLAGKLDATAATATYQPIGDYLIESDLSNYALKTELNDKLDMTAYTADKVTFALKSEIPTDYATDEELTSLTNRVSSIESEISGATETINEIKALI